MQSLDQFFQYMNDVDFPYVVLRNFDNLPHSIYTKGHGDLDLLVYDRKHFEEIFPDIMPVYPMPRAQYRMNVGNLNLYVDVRSVGDGYYPNHFSINMIETRVYNKNGFFTPNPLHFRLALAYHAVHHKNANNYKKHLGNVTVEELLGAIKDSRIGYSIPEDHTVGTYNQYWKGATSVVSKKDGKVVKEQTGYSDYGLIDNEARILEQCASPHFPKVVEKKDNLIELEDCGERLNVDNLPHDWYDQLVEIIDHLRVSEIEHRDIKPDNLMVKDGVIKLIDFGWSRFKDDEADNPPKCLGYPYKPSYGFDDNFSMRRVIKELNFKLEERMKVNEEDTINIST